MIGTISLNHLNEEMKTAEVGYVLNQSYWGQGLMPEALGKIIQASFELFDFNCLWAVYDVRNDQSSKVIKKCGFTYVYTDPYSRYDFVDKEQIVTDVFYRITKKDYALSK